jgi:hypothetical protein
VWPGRRRIRRLESELALARADRADLRRRLEAFEMIASAAGAALEVDVPAPPPDGVQAGRSQTPPPATLVAAAREARPQDFPVRLEMGGTQLIAVIGGPGDPREWWSAIASAARPGGDAS